MMPNEGDQNFDELQDNILGDKRATNRSIADKKRSQNASMTVNSPEQIY